MEAAPPPLTCTSIGEINHTDFNVFIMFGELRKLGDVGKSHIAEGPAFLETTFELQAIIILRDTTRVKGPANPLTFAGPLTFGAGPLTRCVTLNHYCLQFKSGFLAFWRLHKQYPANPLMK